MKELAAALLAAQQALPVIHKDSRATVPTKSGGSFTYTYLSLPQLLDTVVPVLNTHGLALTQMPSFHDGRETLVTRLIHGPSGEMLEGNTPLVLNGDATPQVWGGAITYARRYALTALLGIAADEDDDAQAASSVRAAARPSVTPGAAAQPYRSPGSGSADGSASATAGSGNPGAAKTVDADPDPSDPVVPFGKHKGKRISEIPPPYLVWLSENFEPKSEHDQVILNAVKDAVIPF